MKKTFQLSRYLLTIFICLIGLGNLLLYVSQDFYTIVCHFRSEITGRPYYPVGEKYWAHKCNNPQLLTEMLPHYSGIELDIFFYPQADGGLYIVAHSEEDNMDNPLDNFFAILSSQKDTGIWLDFKNLDSKNSSAAVEELNRLVKIHNINPQRLVIESPNFIELGKFHQQGYYTSYYCPVDEQRYIQSNKFHNEFKEKVNLAVKSGNVSAVSFPEQYYPLVKASDIETDLLTWYGDDEWFMFFVPVRNTEQERRVKAIEADSQIKIILVDSASISFYY